VLWNIGSIKYQFVLFVEGVLNNSNEFVNIRNTDICTYLKQALDQNRFVDNGVVTCLFLLFSNCEMSSLFCKKLFIFAANNLEM
jgi:hypothetical protein